MADTTALKNRIRAAIKANDNQEITGPVLQQALLDMVDELDLNPELENEAQQRQNGDTQLNNLITGIKNSIDNGYVYAGIATPSTTPASGKVFYIASKNGTYSNFGGIIVEYEVVILYNENGTWQKEDCGIQVSLEKKRTNTLNGGQALIYFNIRDYRGEKISVKVTGDFSQYGYYKSPSDDYEVLGYTPDVWSTFDVPQDATALFVFNSAEKGITTPTMEIRTNIASEVVENTEDIAANTEDIQNLKNISKLGYCYKGLLSINASNKTFTTTFIYAGIGKNGFKSMNNVSNKAITPKADGGYSGFWVAFLNWDTVEIEIYMFDSIPTNLDNRYVVATGHNFGPKSVQFSTSRISPSVFGQNEDIATNAQNIATNAQNIAIIKNSLGGILWSNLFEGSDMEKGYNQSNILAFSTYPNIGGTVEKILDDETSRYCIKAHFPTGTEFTSGNNFVYPSLMKNISFIGEDTTQEFSVSFRYKCSPNFKGFCPLCNGGWMEYLKDNGSWGFLGATTIIPLERDNKWHYAHIVARKTGVENKTYSIALYAYFAVGTAVTLEEDLDFCITDIVISPSRFPDYAVVRNVNDYLTPVDKETLQPTVNEIIREYPDAYGCVFMSLGDSITTEGYYIAKLRQILQPSKYYNLAVASATWADRSNTTSYDGNPQFQGDQSQNVLGNQVQKIINNPDVYNVAPDIIIIAAGTNDGTPSSQEMEWNTIETYFTQNGGAESVPCTTPTFDESDTYKDMRKTITGAMRYVCSKLQEIYPKARIYILTPIQGSFKPNKNYNTQIRLKQQHISNVAEHLALPVIHVGENCGINQDFEYGGHYWKSEWATEQRPKNGRDLIDGLHPNTSGSWKMAKYIARELLNNYVNQNY